VDFEYCESCGKRISADDIEAGEGGYVGSDYYCAACAPTDAEKSGGAKASASPAKGRNAPAFARPQTTQRSARETRGQDEYYEEERQPERRNTRGTSNRRPSRPDRAPQRGNEDKKKMLMIGGAVGGVILLIVIIAVVAQPSGKSIPTFTPTASTAPTAPPYATAESQARAIMDKAISIYKKGKELVDPRQQAKGIQAAITEIEKAQELLQNVTSQYEAKKMQVPKSVEDLLGEINQLLYMWHKSMPLNV